jgi:hypothetical protein
VSTWHTHLQALGACEDAMQWAKGFTSFDDAWKACPRGDWMLWLLGKLAGPPEGDARRRLVRAAVSCARTALVHVKDEKSRAATKRCLDVALAWSKGKATIEQLRGARLAAATGYADAVAYAAYAARLELLRKSAIIVRRFYPVAPALKGGGK